MVVLVNITEVRNEEGHKTLEAAYGLLQKYRRAMVVRPTGFGKSHMLAYLSRRYDKSLYVYPLDIIKIDMSRSYKDVLNNTTFLSYRALLEMHKRGELKEFLLQNKFGIIMFDEVHMIGATGFRETYETFNWAIKNIGTHIIGVTATPDRMDEYDYQTELFKNKRVYEYTIHDCVQRGIMLEPYYVRSSFDVEADKDRYRKAANKLRAIMKSDKLEEFIRQKDIEVANLLNASQVIEKHIRKVYNNEVTYLKFIVFFSNIKNLHETKMDVANWFHDAFPSMEINTLTVSSESEYRQNLKKLDELQPRDNTIDLVLCVDMLNMGYHVDSVSGVVLIRGTQSDRIYKQQVGRCLSVKAKRRPIIFDFVNNYRCAPFFLNKEGNGTGQGHGVNAYGSRGSEDLQALDLIIEDNVGNYAEIMERLASWSRSYIEDLVVYLYRDRHMPIYVIAEKTNQKRDIVKKILRKHGIQLEDEAHLKNVVNSPKLLYYANRGRGKSSVDIEE